MKQLLIRLPEELKEKVESKCEKHSLSITAYIRLLIIADLKSNS